MIRNADSDGAALGMLQAFRHFLGRFQNKSITARRVAFQQAEFCIIHFCILRDFRQIAAHQRHVMLLVQFAYLADARHGILVIEMTAQCIARIRGVNHNAAVAQHFSRLPNQARVGVIGMDGKKL